MTSVVVEGTRPATTADLPVLLDLYEKAKEELRVCRGRWYECDALPEPVADVFGVALRDEMPFPFLLLGTIDNYPVGYLLATLIPMLPQAEDSVRGHLRFFVEMEAREIGIAEAMLDVGMERFRAHGVSSADITVLPGQRAAKNFCEQHGFVARSLTMHRRW